MLLFTTLQIAPSLRAETVYVTDELRLGLFDNELTNGRQFKTLVSGAALEVLERSLMTIRVRTEEGDEGWVKTAYIVTTEPGRRRALTLSAENSKLESSVAEKTAAVLALEAEVVDLEARLTSAEAGIVELPALRDTNSQLEARISNAGSMIAMHWLLLATGAALIAGFAIGYYWLDRRVRRQFGGVRVY